jgi:exonuclease III
MDVRFEKWNVRSIYRACSLKTVSSEMAKCSLDLMAVQEVRWENGGSEPADD